MRPVFAIIPLGVMIIVGVVLLGALLRALRCGRLCPILALLVIGAVVGAKIWSRAAAPMRPMAISASLPPGYRTPRPRVIPEQTQSQPWLLESATPATQPSARLTGKLWVDDWAAYVTYIASQGAGQRVLRAESPHYAPTDDEARLSARQQAVTILLPYIPPHLASDPRMQSMLLETMVGDRQIVLDEQLDRVERPYGDLWRARLLIDASPQRLNPILARYSTQVQREERQQMTTWGSLAAMLGVVVLLYLFLNAATKGYFVWKLRAAAVMIAIVAVLALFTNMRM